MIRHYGRYEKGVIITYLHDPRRVGMEEQEIPEFHQGQFRSPDQYGRRLKQPFQRWPRFRWALGAGAAQVSNFSCHVEGHEPRWQWWIEWSPLW